MAQVFHRGLVCSVLFGVYASESTRTDQHDNPDINDRVCMFAALYYRVFTRHPAAPGRFSLFLQATHLDHISRPRTTSLLLSPPAAEHWAGWVQRVVGIRQPQLPSGRGTRGKYSATAKEMYMAA